MNLKASSRWQQVMLVLGGRFQGTRMFQKELKGICKINCDLQLEESGMENGEKKILNITHSEEAFRKTQEYEEHGLHKIF